MDWCPWKEESIIFSHFGELSEKSPKNAQNSPKSSKIAVFRLLVNEYPIEIDHKNSDWKLIIRRNEKKQ